MSTYSVLTCSSPRFRAPPTASRSFDRTRVAPGTSGTGKERGIVDDDHGHPNIVLPDAFKRIGQEFNVLIPDGNDDCDWRGVLLQHLYCPLKSNRHLEGNEAPLCDSS